MAHYFAYYTAVRSSFFRHTATALLLGQSLVACSPVPRPSYNDRSAVIYGEDGRIEVIDETDPLWLEKARATVALVARSQLTPSSDGHSFQIQTHPSTLPYPFCPGERFTAQPEVAACTGVLVAPDLILTAAHCLHLPPGCNPETGCDYAAQVCPSVSFLFDWRLDAETRTAPTQIDSHSVYQCRKILAGARDPVQKLDWLLVQLDRETTGRTPVTLPLFPTSKELVVGRPVVQIGHPLGRPLKILHGAELLPSQHAHQLVANTDTFVGSSGGPLFDAQTGVLIGLLSTGERDFELDFAQESRCLRSRVCTAETSCLGERYSRVEQAMDTIIRLVLLRPGDSPQPGG